MWISIKEKIREIISNISDYYQMLAHTNLPRVAMLMMLALLIGGAAIMVVEGQTGTFSNFFSSIWWVLVTMTTVGYGDMVPITPVGRVVATVIILAGVILISTFTATVSSIFVAAKIRSNSPGNPSQILLELLHSILAEYGPMASHGDLIRDKIC